MDERRGFGVKEILGCDLRSLALLRILLGFLMFWDLVLRSRDLVAHYTDYGLLPRAALLELGWNPAHLSLHLMSGHWSVMAALFLLAMAASLAVMLGWRTAWATPLAWFMLCSLQNRNPMILNGGDVLLRVVVFWAIFLPWGARWSLDARRNPHWRQLPDQVLTPATLAYLVQIGLIYVFAALLKTGPQWHQEASAVYYALSLDQFQTTLGRLLLEYPGPCQALTTASWWFEAVAAFLLVFPLASGPLRTLGVLGITCMHLGFGLCLHIGVFAAIATVASWGLLPGWFWDRVGRFWTGLRSERPESASKGAAGEPPNLSLGPVRNILVSLLLVYVVVWNIGTLQGPVRVPASLEWVGLTLRLDQIWNMFAPYPLTEDGWYVIEANLRDGRKVDLFRGGSELSWEKPAWVSATYPNERWRKLMMNLWMKDNTGYRLWYARYLTRAWNDTHPPSEQVLTFEIVFMLERTLPDYQKAIPEKVVLWRHDCFARN